ncbi:thrombospondin type-1 domain-containing protein 7A-like [Corticium candelabrum]|uniref:thrombospondin type-1 domain-containing protein 7A-like n=1 Tax=Corticium candelabrum TaxID=121492 RepID=UPI002E256E43|nr:thrombospondin type-1 domain-containing protein 7A-like [Corticium candelabrum]
MLSQFLLLTCLLVGGANTETFEWYREPWGPCMRDKSTCCGTCEQRRDVYCAVVGKPSPVPSRYCDGVQQGRDAFDTVRTCSERDCVQDCVVGEWSEWSVCSKTCGRLGFETRRRDVLEAPDTDDTDNTGRKCDILAQTTTCRNVTNFPPCPVPIEPTGPAAAVYKWRLGLWRSCEPLTSEVNGHACGPGLRRRIVNCVAKNGSLVDELNCKSDRREPSPTNTQACNLPCDCVVSSWSAWSVCSISCIANRTLLDSNSSSGSGAGFDSGNDTVVGGEDPDDPHVLRTRSVLRASQFGGRGCPQLRERQPCDLSSLPDCPVSVWHTEEYGECEINRTISNCGFGLRKRAVVCQQLTAGTDDVVTVSDAFCTGEVTLPGAPPASNPVKPLSSQPCQIQCPEDCEMGQWRVWSKCSQSCGEGGVRTRQRPILADAKHGGRECGATIETRSCEILNCTFWFVTQFSNCHANSGTCGDGTRIRNVFCQNALGSPTNISHCDYLPHKPNEDDNCYIPCSDDCVLSAWSLWTTCPFDCGRAGSVVTRHRSVDINATNGKCVDSDELRQKKPCNAFVPCISYVWITDPWQVCVPQGNKTCGELVGEQTRNVYCEQQVAGFGKGPGDKCVRNDIPVSRQSCTINCPVDCDVSAWSQWLKCSATCGQATRTRSQFINQTAAFGGKECPPNVDGIITDTGECTQPPCYAYAWETGDWTNCSLFFVNETCGPGFQTRPVVCRRNDGDISPSGVCSETLFIAQPGDTQNCYIACADECVFTSWSEFGPCSVDCGPSGGIQNRTRSVLSEGSIVTDFANKCPHIKQSDLVEYNPCNDKPCVTYQHVPTNWLSCILPAPNECGGGQQRRYIQCERSDRVFVSASKCFGMSLPDDVRQCVIDCPIDCELSQWSMWSECCGAMLRSRYRTVIQQSKHGGRLCSSVRNQTAPCASQCQWKVGDWGTCSATSGQCGAGTRQRSVTCQVDSQTGSDASCLSLGSKPIKTTDCDVPCVKTTCIVGPWSEWGKCEKYDKNSLCHQLDQGQETRSRSLLRAGSGNNCLKLEEVRQCSLLQCLAYNWNEGSWGDCLLVSANSQQSCGTGYRRRSVTCDSTSGPTVSDVTKCNASLKPVERENCSISCPVDCQVSQWSTWSNCNGTCGGHGSRQRSRRVTTTASNGGRVCPSPLLQTEHCEFSPCYTYSFVRSEWSKCSVGINTCGIGERLRSVKCVQHDGIPASSPSCCLEGVCRRATDDTTDVGSDFEVKNDIHQEERCGEPCPGDCLLSSWSSWSPCTKDCFAGVNTQPNTPSAGTQIRSRGIIVEESEGGLPCSTHRRLFRSCVTSNCFTYKWQTGKWTVHDNRTVDCYQFNGDARIKIVSVGCDPLTRPSHSRICTDGCPPNTMCTNEGECVCMENYEMDISRTCFPTSGCSNNIHCPMENTECNTTTGRCQCKSDWKVQEDSANIEECTAFIGCNPSCRENERCDSTSKACICVSGFISDGTDCYPENGCLSDKHCVKANLMCNKTALKCVCKECGENMECIRGFVPAAADGCVEVEATPVPLTSDSTPTWAWIILAVGIVILLLVILIIVICTRRRGYKKHTFNQPLQFERMDHIGPRTTSSWISDPPPRPISHLQSSSESINKPPLDETDFNHRPTSPSDDSDLDVKKPIYDTETDTDFDGYQSTLEKRRY